MSLLGHTALKYVTGTRLNTSSGRGWTTVLAERWSHNAGVLPSVLPRETEVAILLSGRTIVDRRGAGQRQETWGHRGTVWLCPAGIREEFIDFRQPLDDILHIFLPAEPFANCVSEDLNMDPARAKLRYEAIEYDPFIEQVALSISRELITETAAGHLLVESLGYALSAHLVHRYSQMSVNKKPPVPLVKPIDRRRMSRVMEFIHSRLDRQFSVAELASQACLSPAHFARAFKATTGCTPHSFVNQMRLEVARQMLADPQRSMSDIALSAGFSTPSNFSRAFRDATGMTPGDYRVSQGGIRFTDT